MVVGSVGHSWDCLCLGGGAMRFELRHITLCSRVAQTVLFLLANAGFAFHEENFFLFSSFLLLLV